MTNEWKRPRITCSRVLEWDAAHRVLRHESKCSTLHGHRYRAVVTCSAMALDDVGRVVDFGVVKEKLGSWIDEHLDHTTIVNPRDKSLLVWCLEEHERGKRHPYVMPPGHDEPTAENIAAVLLQVGQRLFDVGGLSVESVVVYETPNCWAEAHR